MTPRFEHHIDGEDRPALRGRALPVFDPCRGTPWAEVAAGDGDDVEAAVAAAQRALPGWAALKPSERARWLERLADALEAESQAFVALESRDTGKPLALCRDVEIPRAVANLRFFAAAARTFGSESFHGEAGWNLVLRPPVGVVATISPWNLPLYLFTWKLAPALAAGCTVVAKPSEITPATATAFAQLAARVGLPRGVLNVVNGEGRVVGEALVRHAAVKAVSFTGSTAVGRRIAAICGERLKKASLELGGKNATIAFEDVAPRDAVALIARAAFQNAGQICLCGSRLLVPRARLQEWRDALRAEVAGWTAGPPSDPEARLGPLASEAQFEKVRGYLALAANEGGAVLAQGRVLESAGGEGWWQAPVVVEGLPIDSRCATEEIFGPVLTLHPFDDEQHAVAMANATAYGLSAVVLTSDLARAHRVAAALDVGLVWINTWMQRDLRTPFGGNRDSGLGREGGWDAMRFFTESRTVCLAT
jgi:aminomuconate-semialdehyde/2-hydroxymuconate-6-semialdehyde dehydrogenase